MCVRVTTSVGRAVVRRGLLDHRVDRLEVVDVVEVQHLPAVGLVASGDVLGEGDLGRAVDRDAVVVPEDDEPAEAEVAGERGGLLRDALHQVAVGGDHPGAVVDDLVTGLVEPRREHALGERHADGR